MSWGLISGLGKGISDAGTTVGNAMMRKMERDEAAAQREREKEEDREFRRQQDALYRKPADAAGSGSSSGGGGKGGGSLSLEDIAEGGKAEAIVAREMGVDVPTLRKLRRGSETGDWSAFEQPTEDPNVGPVKYALPDGFEKYAASKTKALANVEKTFVFGKDYKDVAAGEQTAFETGLGQGVVAGTMDPTKASQATSVMKGNAPFGGDSNVTRNVVTGDVKTTPVGQSAIFENNAQARKALADAAKDANNPNAPGAQDRLTTIVNSANSTLTNLEENRPGAKDPKEAQAAWQKQYDAAIEVRDLAMSGLRDRIKNDSRPTPAPAPAPRVDNNAGKPDNSPKQTSQFKVGETRTVQNGPNKGKTARWDGKGWALVN